MQAKLAILHMDAHPTILLSRLSSPYAEWSATVCTPVAGILTHTTRTAVEPYRCTLMFDNVEKKACNFTSPKRLAKMMGNKVFSEHAP